MSDIAFPFHVDASGRTAVAGEDAHVRELIEQVLFTNPGERVNRPTFGSGLLKLIFAPNDDVLATATQLVVHGQLQQWLSDVVLVEAVDVAANDASLVITVTYVRKTTQQRTISQFTRTIP